MSTSIFVLSACSGDKAIDPVIDCSDIDAGTREELVNQFPNASMEAGPLYTGYEHEHVKAAVDRFGELGNVEWRISLPDLESYSQRQCCHRTSARLEMTSQSVNEWTSWDVTPRL